MRTVEGGDRWGKMVKTKAAVIGAISTPAPRLDSHVYRGLPAIGTNLTMQLLRVARLKGRLQ